MKIHQVKDFTEAILAYPFIESIDKYYPDIGYWFMNKALPGIVTGKDVLLMAKEGNRVIGVSLGKISDEENKLRCVRVAEDYTGSGLGVKLMDKTLDIIGDKPIVTVSEELLHSYSRIFVNRYGFDLTSVNKGMYRPKKLEYIFNQ